MHPVFFILFASLALAALQNITVDDAVSIGAAVPMYFPSPSDWNQGNNCSGCYVKPDPSYAYNATWHDMTFRPYSSISQRFEFTFVGSGLYIFFILANNVPNATTFTSVNFFLDGILSSSFSHTPSTSTDFEYNQTVYANSSIPMGEHTMIVAPTNDGVDSVLILFDYLIYTTDADTATTTILSLVTPSPLSVSTATILLSSTQSSSPSPISTPSSGPNIGTIVGGVVAGVGTLIVIAVSLLYHQRYKRRNQSSTVEVTQVVEPFILSREMPPTSSEATSLQTQRMPVESPSTGPGSRSKLTGSPATSQPSNTASDVTQSSSGTSSSGSDVILEQVGQLRDEVARLRRLQGETWSVPELGSEPPPEYTITRH